jgi:hypothetical protein
MSTRQPNAIDFWRGLALVMIFVNHVPGNVFVPLTLRNYSICDAAEVFVFLAGWSMSYVAGPAGKPRPFVQVRQRFVTRAGQVYGWQLATTAIAIAMVGIAARAADNALFFEWKKSGAAFYDPVRAAAGVVLLSYQVGYFNILPLYVALLLMAPVMVWLFRIHWAAAFGVSLAVYGLAGTFRLSPPSWPAEDPWYFNPLSWQLMMLIGFATAQWSAANPAFAAKTGRWWPLAAALVAVSAGLTLLQIRPDPLGVPEPRAFFTFEKAYLAPARILSLLALAVCFRTTYDWLNDRAMWLCNSLCQMGRHSLIIFSLSSILALAGQIIRFVNDGSLVADILIIGLGLSVMTLVARWLEWQRD